MLSLYVDHKSSSGSAYSVPSLDYINFKFQCKQEKSDFSIIAQENYLVFFAASFLLLVFLSCRHAAQKSQHKQDIRVNKQEAGLLSFLVWKNSALNTPSSPCSKTSESFPRALKAKQITI